MSLNTVSTTYDYEIGDTVYYVVPRSAADITFKQFSIKQATILAKRNYVQPTQSTPTIQGPNVSTIQYDVRFLDNSQLTVTPAQLLSGVESITSIIV